MWDRCKIETIYRDIKNSHIEKMATNPNNATARIEYVLRHFRSSWPFSFGEQLQVKKICEDELQKNPQHNFFNYALAQLEDSKTKKIKHLIAAARYQIPYPIISAQAAYEVADLSYTDASQKVSAAWLSKALILNHAEATENFLQNKFCTSGKPIRKTIFYAIFLTTLLSRCKITELSKSEILQEFKAESTLITQAYHYPLDNALNYVDSPVIKILELFIAYAKNGFVNYFSYCLQQDIIDAELFKKLIIFYLNSNYTDQYDLRSRAIETIQEQKLQHLFSFQLSVPAFVSDSSYGSTYHLHAQMYATAPLTYPSAPHMTTMPPQEPFIPAVAQSATASSTLVPIYDKNLKEPSSTTLRR